MNKLEGLYELKKLNIPTIEWECYNSGTNIDDNHLWTIRTAVYNGFGLNLPCLFDQNASATKKFADKIMNILGDRGVVIYYPCLIAEKSSNLQLGRFKIVIKSACFKFHYS